MGPPLPPNPRLVVAFAIAAFAFAAESDARDTEGVVALAVEVAVTPVVELVEVAAALAEELVAVVVAALEAALAVDAAALEAELVVADADLGAALDLDSPLAFLSMPLTLASGRLSRANASWISRSGTG